MNNHEILINVDSWTSRGFSLEDADQIVELIKPYISRMDFAEDVEANYLIEIVKQQGGLGMLIEFIDFLKTQIGPKMKELGDKILISRSSKENERERIDIRKAEGGIRLDFVSSYNFLQMLVDAGILRKVYRP